MPEPEIENSPVKDLSVWAALGQWGTSLPRWQRYILAVAASRGALTGEEVENSYQLFLADKRLLPAGQPEPAIEIPEAIPRPTQALADQPKLTRVDELRGINALPEGAALTFGPELTVVYGRNGAGKSGFARLFANACFSRQQPTIIGDIYAGGTAPAPAARFHIEIGTDPNADVPFPDPHQPSVLKRISVFDSAVARLHIGQATGFEFRPTGFDVFPEMVRVQNLICERLDSDIRGRTRANEFPQSFLGGGTAIHEAVAGLGPSSDLGALRELGKYGETESARLAELDAQIVALKSQSPSSVLEALRQAKDDVALLREQLSALEPEFGSAGVDARRKTIAAAKEAQDAAAIAGSDQFKRPFFNAVGSPEWERFASAAHALAKKEGEDYPADGDKCLLCERALDATSKAHVEALLTFVEGDARKSAVETRQALTAEITRLTALDMKIFAANSRVRGHVERLAPELAKSIDARATALAEARTAAITSLKDMSVKATPLNGSELDKQLEALGIQIDADVVRLEAVDTTQAIASLEEERKMLRHRQVLSQLLASIEQFVADANWAQRAQAARQSLNTRSITDKEKELFSHIVGGTYRTQLGEECEALDCDVPIELQTIGRSGQTLRSIAMPGGHKPETILSEGEQKAVALADFLTEVSLNPASAAIVFDDPVTSQDHQRKERIATRLTREAGHRQVIVFTHDLVFLNQLFNAADAQGRQIEGHWVDRAPDGRPGRVALGDSPVTSRSYEKTDRAKAAHADAVAAAGSEREDFIRKGMGALRTTLEETVVRKVFKDAVPRWTDQVRVTTLRRINWDDAKIEELCELYEELSRYIEGHSHTDEATGAPVTPEELANYIKRVDDLLKWAKADRSP